MSDKFESIPVDDGTMILAQVEVKLGEYDVAYQKWIWDGVFAESVIFADEDVKNINDAEIISIVKESPLLSEGSKITISNTGCGFTFVNFNFKSLE